MSELSDIRPLAQAREIQGVHHGVGKTVRVKVDRTLKDVRAGEFDAVQLWSPTF